VNKTLLVSQTQAMPSKAWSSSRGEKRLNVGYRHQIPRRIIIRPCSNVRKAQDFGSCKVIPSRNGRHSKTPFYGSMVFPDVARRFSAPLSLKISRGPFRVNLFSTSSSTSMIMVSKYWTAWSDPILVSFTTSARILGNYWIRSIPLAKLDVTSQVANHFVKFSYKW